MAAAPLRMTETPAPDESHPALNAILGANPFVGIDAAQVAGNFAMFWQELWRQPENIASRAFQLGLDLTAIALGNSNIAPDPGDRRFSDPAWSDHPLYKRIMQSYLAWRTSVHALLDGADANGDWKNLEQQRFALTLLTEALAPTNFFWLNPAAIKRLFETAGMSVIAGMRNFFDDLANNGAMPATVDKRPFTVGKNLAVTPGAVVHRGELCEVIQYAPATDRVYERPLLVIPPQINKFYILDLAPKRSFAEFAVVHGVPFFTISWRNPTPANRDWSLDDYVAACKEAVDVVCEITGSRDANVLGVCAGGITTALMLGHLAAAGSSKVRAATLMVTMLDTSLPSMTGMFATADAIAAAIRRSRAKGVLDGAEMARVFSWLRPNDLVWNYWVNNYLMGNDPPAFDILYWNSDSTNLPAALHEGFLEIFLKNPLGDPDALTVLGAPINLRRVTSDLFIVAGATDHICAWRACYRSTQMFGGQTDFVLSSSGHIQSLVNPPGNLKARFFTNPRLGADPDAWLDAATEHKGSWWTHWMDWLAKRSGEQRPAPKSLGSAAHPALDPAPGRYVHQRII